MSTLSQRISEKLGADIVAGKLAPGAKLDEEGYDTGSRSIKAKKRGP